MSRPVLLSIAGFDPSSGAGITADLKVMTFHGCYGVTCITALTVQSTQGVRRVESISGELVRQTLECLAEDFDFAAVKIGMLGSGEVANSVARFLRERRPHNVVVDPVLISSSGASLLDEPGRRVLTKEILPMATVITPNLVEAKELVQLVGSAKASGDPWILGESLHQAGAKYVVITGGHEAPAVDRLVSSAGRVEFPGEWIESRSTHGTGCAFASSLACHLAIGLPIEDSVRNAKCYVARAIAKAFPTGKGLGPLNHFPGE